MEKQNEKMRKGGHRQRERDGKRGEQTTELIFGNTDFKINMVKGELYIFFIKSAVKTFLL